MITQKIRNRNSEQKILGSKYIDVAIGATVWKTTIIYESVAQAKEKIMEIADHVKKARKGYFITLFKGSKQFTDGIPCSILEYSRSRRSVEIIYRPFARMRKAKFVMRN